MSRRFFIAKTIALATAAFIIGSGPALRSQSAPAGIIRSFGTFASPDGTKKVVVTRRSVSLVDFQVLDAAGKELAKDYVGSDAMRWFLHWESPARLWGYGSDIGYFKLFEFQADGTTKITQMDRQTPVPKVIWDNLPSSLQKRYKVVAAK